MTAQTATARLGIRPSALPAWRRLQEALDGAAVPCTGDPDAWWSEDPDVRAYAARACIDCVAIERCGRFAEANRETAGVWAGVDRTPTAGRPAQRKERSA